MALCDSGLSTMFVQFADLWKEAAMLGKSSRKETMGLSTDSAKGSVLEECV